MPRQIKAPQSAHASIKVRKSKIEGRGVFARVAIPPESHVMTYLGEVISKPEATRRLKAGNPYIFTLNDTEDLDGDIPANLARYVNHSCEPNCESRHDDDEIRIYAIKAIEPKEELTMNYGYAFEDYSDHPCRCGAPSCVGFVVAEEHFAKVRRIKQKKKTSKRARRRPDQPDEG